ncbi:hypothetical protein HL42_0865 [Trichophyton rubrum]|nr:hypothetical protein HL42_0865 [Trichophyton rubrum]
MQTLCIKTGQVIADRKISPWDCSISGWNIEHGSLHTVRPGANKFKSSVGSQWINILDTQFIFQPPNDHGTAHCYHIDWKAVLVLLFCAGSKSITLSTMTCISNAASFSSAEPLFFVPQGLFFAWRSPDPPRRVDVTSLWLVNCS